MTIPRLSQRLECMIYRRKLDLDIEEIRPELNILRNASQELRSSAKFKKILQVRPVLMWQRNDSDNSILGRLGDRKRFERFKLSRWCTRFPA